MELKQRPPLHTLRVQRIRATINRAHIFVHSLILLALLYYRASWLFFFLTSDSHSWSLNLTWFLLLTSELTLSFIWLLGSAYRWRPVSRVAFPERLSNDHQLPVIDVFICTADPEKEPPLHVMNTVLSAMALDYPAEKLWVYLSDDGGAAITLYAMRQAFSFAKVWLPFCREYGVRATCPNAYFSEVDGQIRSAEFLNERQKMKSMYEAFKEQVSKAEEMGLIGDDNLNKAAKQDGASLIEIWWYGCDGLNGPILSGSGFYMKREALYGIAPGMDLPKDLIQRRQWFGSSNELLKTLRPDYKCNAENGIQSNGLLQEAHFLASCNYETGTKWGKQVGFLYDSVVEDVMTGILLHCRGWNSVYYNPPRPQFLGSSPINLNDVLVQYKRWMSGLLEIAFSRYSPLPYGIMSGHSILHTMCLSYPASVPFYCVFGLCYAAVPQLCLLNGISLYPKVSDPWFAIFLAVFISGSCQHLFEVLHTGGSFRMWWNEQRIWMVKSISACFFGCLDIATRMIGVKRVDFGLTSKVIEKDQVDRYANEVFDFQGASLILVPVVTSSMLNMVALIGGVWRVIAEGNYSELMVQLSLTLFIIICSYPIIEGIVIRKDAARVPPLITFLSIICTVVLLSLGFIVFAM